MRRAYTADTTRPLLLPRVNTTNPVKLTSSPCSNITATTTEVFVRAELRFTNSQREVNVR
jgi:hypothetical protein